GRLGRRGGVRVSDPGREAVGEPARPAAGPYWPQCHRPRRVARQIAWRGGHDPRRAVPPRRHTRDHDRRPGPRGDCAGRGSLIQSSERTGQGPGAPGIVASWTGSAKDIVGCSLGPARLWFTMGFGIINEVYYPRVDIPQIRDLGFIVAVPDGFWSEVKRNQNYKLS